MAKVLGVLGAALVAWALTATAAVAEGRWQQLENNPSCIVWNARPQSNETVTWTDACVDGKAQGRGTQVWRFLNDGEWKKEEYEGDLKDGKRHGRGVLVRASGDRYEGDWKDGKEHGRGVYVWANGDECKGDWREGRLVGTGSGIRNGQSKKCYWAGNGVVFAD